MRTGQQAKRQARVTKVTPLGSGIGRVDLEGDGIGLGVRPGMFAMVEAVGRPDCILLRPYSYFLAPHRDGVALLVKDVGKGTRGLLTARPGDPVAVFGPLGNQFPSEFASCWAVAGGVGAAPFGGFAQAVDFKVLFGARSVGESGFAQALRDEGLTVDLATDDGSAGFRGSVVKLLDERLSSGPKPSVIYCCGPTAMMEAAAQVAYAHGVACWVSLEARMGCGIGVCRGCAHADANGAWRCVCVDGPVYEARTIFAAGPKQAQRGAP